MIRTSEQINEISEALAKAQGKFGAAIKGSQNPAFRSKYADLSAVIDATLEHLNGEGITCMQHPALTYAGDGESREAMITVTTRLLHKTGQWIESDLSIPAVQRDRFDAQSCGSALTYACRYALQSICVVPREDDDGNTAAGIGSKQAAQDVAKQKLTQWANEGNKSAKEALARNNEIEPHEPVPPSIDPGARLFYVWHNESQTAEVMGDKKLMERNRRLLKLYWNGAERKVIVNGEELETLKFQFEKNGTPFEALKEQVTQ